MLCDQPELFGEVASQPTAWRLLDAIDESLLTGLQAARAASRAKVWAAGLAPEAKRVTLDFDATLVDATLVDVHTDDRRARSRPTRRVPATTRCSSTATRPARPSPASCDETGEAFAGKLRRGSAGANTAADHICLLDAAVAQLRLQTKDQLRLQTKEEGPENGVEVLVRAGSAGATHGFVNAALAKRLLRLDRLRHHRGRAPRDLGVAQGALLCHLSRPSFVEPGLPGLLRRVRGIGKSMTRWPTGRRARATPLTVAPRGRS